MNLPPRHYIWSGYTGLTDLKPLLDCCGEFLPPLFKAVYESRDITVLQNVILFFHVAYLRLFVLLNGQHVASVTTGV